MIKPNSLFFVWSADDAAECLTGIPDNIYSKIWNEIVPLYDSKIVSDWNDNFEDRCLARFWNLFSDDEKCLLNDLAERE